MLLTEALRSRLRSCGVMRKPVSPSAGLSWSPLSHSVWDPPRGRNWNLRISYRVETVDCIYRLRFSSTVQQRMVKTEEIPFPHRRLRCGGSSMQLGRAFWLPCGPHGHHGQVASLLLGSGSPDPPPGPSDTSPEDRGATCPGYLWRPWQSSSLSTWLSAAAPGGGLGRLITVSQVQAQPCRLALAGAG